MVGVEAPDRAVGLRPRASHRAVEVDRQARQAVALDVVVDEVADRIGQALEQRGREGLEPAHHGSVRRQPVQPAKAQQHRVRPHEGDVRHPHPADHEQPDHREHPPRRAAIAAPGGAAERRGHACRARAVPCTAAQARIVDAALALFAEHGISGTSPQMIADGIGVTKAAVHHHYDTKGEIVLAVALPVLAVLDAAVTAAEAERCRARAREVLVVRMIALAVERRPMASVRRRDPVMLRSLQEHAPFRRVMERVNRVLMGGVAHPPAPRSIRWPWTSTTRRSAPSSGGSSEGCFRRAKVPAQAPAVPRSASRNARTRSANASGSPVSS